VVTTIVAMAVDDGGNGGDEHGPYLLLDPCGQKSVPASQPTFIVALEQKWPRGQGSVAWERTETGVNIFGQRKKNTLTQLHAQVCLYRW
jgi:hypothetical protein